MDDSVPQPKRLLPGILGWSDDHGDLATGHEGVTSVPTPDDLPRPRDQVRSVSRALRVLEVVSASPAPPTVKAVARRVGLKTCRPPTTWSARSPSRDTSSGPPTAAISRCRLRRHARAAGRRRGRALGAGRLVPWWGGAGRRGGRAAAGHGRAVTCGPRSAPL